MNALTGRNEIQEIESINQIHNKDTLNQFKELLKLAQKVTGVKFASMAILENEKWTLTTLGIDLDGNQDNYAFCNKVKELDKYLIIDDLSTDPNFKNHRFVTSEPHLRFYAGFPLKTQTGKFLGTVCLADSVNHEITEEILYILQVISNQIVVLIENSKLNADLQKSYNQLLKVARSALINEMTKSVSHEINNPLTAIMNGVSVLEDFITEHPHTPRDLKAVSIVNAGIARIQKVVKALAELSNSSLDDLRLTPCSKVLEQTVDLIKSKSKFSGVTIEMIDICTNEGCTIPYRIEEVLFHIMANACEASLKNSENADPHVTIKSSFSNERMIFTITDSGKGFEEETLRNLFSPFFHSGYNGKMVGLGLSVSKLIMDSVAGEIRFVGNNPTTFEVVVSPISLNK